MVHGLRPPVFLILRIGRVAVKMVSLSRLSEPWRPPPPAPQTPPA